MRSSILLLVLAALVFESCTTAYKTGQTPDDVYFSPERPQDEYVNIQDNNNDNRYYGSDDYYDDQYLRMKVRNRAMWSDLDDWYNSSPGYSYNYNSYNSWNWNNPWSPSTYWNYYYNPYCSPTVYISKGNFAYNHPRIFNLNSYNNTQLARNTNMSSLGHGMYNNNYSNNQVSRPVRMIGVNSSKNNNLNSNAGSFLRNIFNGSSNNSGNNNNSSSNSSVNNPGRSSSSSSSSSGSSGGSTAPVRKF